MTASKRVAVTGGTVIDGTGGPPRVATVVIADDRIELRQGAARHVVDRG